MPKKCFFLTLFFFALVFAGCSHKVTRIVHKVPQIRVKHQGQILELDLEDYVSSVLAGEVVSTWPKAALQAQAVAARTFAILRMRERKNQPFHIQSSVMDQVYKRHKTQSFIDAAKATAGQVLFFEDRLAETSFHSTCGGRTSDSHSIWGRPYQHLQGVKCTYCKNSNTYSWSEVLPLDEIETKLKQKVKDIKIISRSPDGRVQSLELVSDKRVVRMSGHELRMAIGPMRIKSTLLTNLKISGTKVHIAGRGFGHGVGMCQNGMLGMALAKKDYREILNFYYPGTKLRALY